jgi:hypothetical protein
MSLLRMAKASFRERAGWDEADGPAVVLVGRGGSDVLVAHFGHLLPGGKRVADATHVGVATDWSDKATFVLGQRMELDQMSLLRIAGTSLRGSLGAATPAAPRPVGRLGRPLSVASDGC